MYSSIIFNLIVFYLINLTYLANVDNVNIKRDLGVLLNKFNIPSKLLILALQPVLRVLLNKFNIPSKPIPNFVNDKW